MNHKYDYPVMYLNDQIKRMMPIGEFQDRLKFSKKYVTSNPRACDDELEQENYNLLKQ